MAAWVVGHIVGTMGFFWFCLMLSLFPILVPRVMTTVQFVSSGILQLCLLPLIMVGQNLQGRMAEDAREKNAREAEARRNEIEQASIQRHQAREDRAARHHDELVKRLDAHVEHIEKLCERIATATRAEGPAPEE